MQPPSSIPRGVPKPNDGISAARRIRLIAASNSSSLPKSGSGAGLSDMVDGPDMFNHTPPNFTPCSYEILGPKVSSVDTPSPLHDERAMYRSIAALP